VGAASTHRRVRARAHAPNIEVARWARGAVNVLATALWALHAPSMHPACTQHAEMSPLAPPAARPRALYLCRGLAGHPSAPMCFLRPKLTPSWSGLCQTTIATTSSISMLSLPGAQRRGSQPKHLLLPAGIQLRRRALPGAITGPLSATLPYTGGPCVRSRQNP
jgi:hypothetical protein